MEAWNAWAPSQILLTLTCPPASRLNQSTASQEPVEGARYFSNLKQDWHLPSCRSGPLFAQLLLEEPIRTASWDLSLNPAVEMGSLATRACVRLFTVMSASCQGQ